MEKSLLLRLGRVVQSPIFMFFKLKMWRQLSDNPAAAANARPSAYL